MRSIVRRSVLAALLALSARAGVAQQAQSAPDLSPREQQVRLISLNRELPKLFAAGKYAEAETACRQILALRPSDAMSRYNLACALARQDNADGALEALDAAMTDGYAEPGHMSEDPDLASLRDQKAWRSLLARARKNERDRLARLYEPGRPLDGVKTTEDWPDNGLRYRLHVDPRATAEKPSRLIVWLHPSGGSMNRQVESMAKSFAEHGFALVVFTQKDFRFWSPADARKLAVTLKALRKIEALDAARPVLFGYSAGGQMALMLWREGPAAWGGLVLDAAYPLDAEAYASGRVQLLGAPEAGPEGNPPLFVLVGEQDGGSRIWRKAETTYRDAGIDVTIDYVPGKGHTWLFDARRQRALLTWLGALKTRAATSGPASGPAAAAPASRPGDSPATARPE